MTYRLAHRCSPLALLLLLAACSNLPAPGSDADPLKGCSVGIQGGTNGSVGVDVTTGTFTGNPDVSVEGTVQCKL